MSVTVPDFRSPKTGLYNNLARLNLPHAEAVFDISFFRNNPEPFYILARELYPGKFHPTVSHAFISLLARKGLLQMLFTQNIDCLERVAGVPADKIIEAHGSFASQRCIDCGLGFPDDEMKEHVLEGKVPRCSHEECKGLVKPDITFFGEPLPKAFSHNTFHTTMADLVLIIGTSLSVYPFASLPDMAQEEKPRVLFNMERVGSLGSRPDDVLQLGQCDAGIRKLANALGWREELEELWRGVVGDKEAERQLRSETYHEQEIEEEVQRLTEGVESALKLADDTYENSRDAQNNTANASLANSGTSEPKPNLLPEHDVEQIAVQEKKSPVEEDAPTSTSAAGLSEPTDKHTDAPAEAKLDALGEKLETAIEKLADLKVEEKNKDKPEPLL